MNNLELLELVHKSTHNVFSNVEIFDQNSTFIYYILRGSLHRYNLSHNTTEEICPQCFEEIISIKILNIEQKICIVTEENLHIIDPEGNNEVQSVPFENRIEAVSWNPTEELVVIVFGNGDVATYSIDLENGEVFSQGTSSVETKVPDTVYVGWGSKDTQFRGSEGKLKHKQTDVEVKPIHDKKSTISWRGNSEMFVINYWNNEKRMFVVFETPCKALYRSEECPGLQTLVAWRPTGNMIATLCEVNNRQSVVIFEKNGQKRFGFDLNLGNVEVTQLQWSPCAQILTVVSRNLDTNCQTIHLLTSSNYKWFEKQRLTFTGDNRLLGCHWLETSHFTFKLQVITQDKVITYTFRYVINNFLATCAVIDGKILHLTNFKDAIIPPVMSGQKICNENTINFVVLQENLIAIVDSDNFLKIFDINKSEMALQIINLANIVNDLPKFPLQIHHFLLNGTEVYFAAESDTEVVFYTVNIQSGDLNFISATSDLLKHLINITENIEIVGLQQIENTLYMNDSLLSSVQQKVKVADNTSYSCQLTANFYFYVNNYKLSDSVNSFIIFDNYLLYTTKLNELYCVRFTDKLLNGAIKKYRRNIEQGAAIVTAIPDSPKIVLQMPRGNLETISCRLISIDILDHLLNNSNWEEALRFIRLEKLNANLLFDLNPNRFLNEINQFISGVKTINELNSICIDFEEGNVLNTVYKDWGACEEFPLKIPTIFSAIFKYFDQIDYAPYITTIMIINLNFFSLKAALAYLQDLLRRSYEDVTLKMNLMEAVNTLKTYGCDQEKLYTEALLLYDLDLAHFVASCCQLDPRIYEPHIDNLKNQTEVERRFAINLYAKKPRIAITYLLRCPKITSNEIEVFITTHKVSREAYENCNRNSPHYQTASRLFAEDLSRKGCHQEAGVVLMRAKLLEEALSEFKLGLKWREVVDLLEELKMDHVEKLRTIDELAKNLTRNRMVKDSAHLYEFYAQNYEMAAKVLIDNYFFEDALHIAKKHNRTDIIESDIIPVLCKHKTYLEEKLKELEQNYNKYKTRLAHVRKIKAAKFNNDFEYEGDDRDNDLYSDTDSVTTRSTRSSRSRSSTASSRNRRKEQKKKQDLREGGIYEDIALIRALHYLTKEVYSKQEEIHSCCILLLQESTVSYKEIKELYELFHKVCTKIANGVSEIWPPHFYANGKTENIQELADLENFEHLDVEFRTPPSSDISSLNLFKVI